MASQKLILVIVASFFMVALFAINGEAEVLILFQKFLGSLRSYLEVLVHILEIDVYQNPEHPTETT